MPKSAFIGASDEVLAEEMRRRGVERGRKMRTMPGISLHLKNIRAGKGGPGEDMAVESLWEEARLHDAAQCSDERARTLDALLTASYREGVREGVGT